MSYWKYSPLSLVGNVKTPGRGRRRGLPHPGQQIRAILYRASDARRADRIGEGARRRWHLARPTRSAAKARIIAWFDRLTASFDALNRNSSKPLCRSTVTFFNEAIDSPGRWP